MNDLHDLGLEAYGAQRIVNSRWLKELEAINSIAEFLPKHLEGAGIGVIAIHVSEASA